jgi:hypothetical protein
MSLYCLLNQDNYKIDCQKYYNPLLLIDVKKYNIKCNLTNTFWFYIENPRHNIDLVSGFFEFYFKNSPDEFTLGQVISKSMILYNKEKTNYHDFMPCILFTSGFYLQEILIYLPIQNFLFFRELKYYFYKKIQTNCIICYEDKLCINVHDNHYEHCICMNCLLKLNNTCPLCRLDII